MTDRDRLRQAFEETFDMKTMPGFRQAVVSRAVSARGVPPTVSRFTFAFGAVAAVVLIAGAVALLHLPSLHTAPGARPSPSASPLGKLFNVKQLDDLAAAVYPKNRYGYWAPCDESGNESACPFTPRLQAQLTALRTTACFGCQAPSYTYAATASPTGYVKVVMFEDTQTYSLVVVREGGRLLVDDLIWACPNGGGESVYAMHLTGGPAGVQPYGLAPLPACT